MTSQPSPASQWRAGVARADITPETPIRMGGYGARTKPSAGVRDRLSAKALALDDGAGTRGVILTADLIGIDAPFGEQVLGAIQRRTGVPREHLFVNCSHTHSGPASITLRGLGDPDEAYLDVLARKASSLKASNSASSALTCTTRAPYCSIVLLLGSPLNSFTKFLSI